MPREHPWLAGVMAQVEGRLFLRVSEVAELMRTDPRTVRRGIDAGDIPAVRISSTVRVPVPAFLELLGLSPNASEPPVATGGHAPIIALARTDQSHGAAEPLL